MYSYLRYIRLGHLRVLESLLKGSASCWQIVLTLARVA